MAKFRLFKATYKDRKGKLQETSNWYVEFRDQRDQVRRLPAFTSKPASEEMGRNLVRLVEYYKGTGGQTDPGLITWLTGLELKTRQKLVEIGLLPAEKAAASKPLADHLDDYEAVLKALDNTPKQVYQVVSRAKKIINGCRFQYFADISASKVQTFLHDLRRDSENRKGIGAQTSNFYLSALKQFCRWMVKERRAIENPISHLDGLNVKVDPRHDRRPLTPEELLALLAATRAGPVRFKVSGEERFMIYWLAVETGLRAGELRSLTKLSFDLDGDCPTVTVQAAYSKRRREDTLPLRSELVSALRSHLALKTPDAPAFTMPESQHIAEMLKLDLKAVGIPYVDRDGRHVDFHALRHTFITNLAKGGIHPKTAQALARHSTITLTMDRYSHTLHEELADALNVLPDLTRPTGQEAKKTGTDNRPVSPDQGPVRPPRIIDLMTPQRKMSWRFAWRKRRDFRQLW